MMLDSPLQSLGGRQFPAPILGRRQACRPHRVSAQRPTRESSSNPLRLAPTSARQAVTVGGSARSFRQRAPPPLSRPMPQPDTRERRDPRHSAPTRPARPCVRTTPCRSKAAARPAAASPRRGSMRSRTATRTWERRDDRRARVDRRRALHELPPLQVEHRAKPALAHDPALPALPGTPRHARRTVQIPTARPSPIRRQITFHDRAGCVARPPAPSIAGPARLDRSHERRPGRTLERSCLARIWRTS
jgi:hypothetical protein